MTDDKDLTAFIDEYVPLAYIEHSVPFIQQRWDWDCGIACVLMLLPSPQREHFLKNFDVICCEEGFGQSTWTIDLSYLLKRFGVEHTMYTTMLGVNEAYKKYSYYNGIIDESRSRITSRFVNAEAAGLRVRRGAVGAAALLWALQRGPALALVDARRLACDYCGRNRLWIELRRWFGGSTNYRGHYILLVGVRGRRVLYRDPAGRCGGVVGGCGGAVGGREVCAVTLRTLVAARAAPGTDHDLLIIHKPPIAKC